MVQALYCAAHLVQGWYHPIEDQYRQLTFRNGVALVERVQGKGEGVESDELDDLTEASEVENEVAEGLCALSDLISSTS
ncbi:hypothetical protein BHM03_00061010 [Ensete ventricosum]|nr:hypothetical protein BHM03_00061010 [Ensete ventricosum]